MRHRHLSHWLHCFLGAHSIVLKEIADATYKFLYIDLGSNGRISNGGVFRKCPFNNALSSNQLSLPLPKPLLFRTLPMPYVLVANDALALMPNILKPYMNVIQTIFSYRLSRARGVIENTFGIMSSRFRVMRSPIKLNATKTKHTTLSGCVLHNYLIKRNSSVNLKKNLTDHCTADCTLVPGEWKSEQNTQHFFNL